MTGELRWQSVDDRLQLSGELNHQTLLPLWQQRVALVARHQSVDVAALQRVDSAGLALLIHLRQLARSQYQRDLPIRGITPTLRLLIELYGLQEIIDEAPVTPADTQH